MNNTTNGILYLVATPIGNLGDITARAVQTLTDVDFIAAEDTRVTLKLLGHLGIKKPLVSYYEHNRFQSGAKIIQRLLEGQSCALVSDAGTPAISDPGEELVRMCAEEGLAVLTIPGPCAAVSALSLSGLSSGRFTFEGFLSTSRKSRFEHLQELKNERRTMIFYEAPHKLMRTLEDLLEVFGDRKLSISRELTKLYEETLRMTLSQAIDHFSSSPVRGEFVLVIDGAAEALIPEVSLDDAAKAATALVKEGMSVKDAAKKISEETKLAKNAIYSAVLNRRQ